MSEAALRFQQLTVHRDSYLALDQVTAHVPRGSCTAIIGPNGAGKTSLLLALLGEIPYEGQILFPAEPGQAGPPRLGYVPQRLELDRHLPLSVLEFLALGVQRRPIFLGLSRRCRQQLLDHLALIRAEHLAQRRLGALSGGELQQVLLALALLRKPQLLVLDEPAAGVDFSGEQLFCDLLESLRIQQGFTLLMVSHDLSRVTHHATHVICLKHRLLAEGPPQAVLTGDNLRQLFGLHMGLVKLQALPQGEQGQGGCSSSCCADPRAQK